MKFKVTKVIAIFLPILLGFHLLGVLDCLPLVADTISLDMLVHFIRLWAPEKSTYDKQFKKRLLLVPAAIFSLQDAIYLKSLSLKLTSNFSFPFLPILAILVAKEAVTMATVGYRGKCPI